MIRLTNSGAENFADTVWSLYSAMSKKFGSDRAWEFILEFYKGGASSES